MLKIRLTRRGRRNDPSFRLVVTEQSNPVKGKFLEDLGHYNPKLKTKVFKQERILYWLGQGAKCSATTHNLLVSEKIIEGAKVKAWRPKAGSADAKNKESKDEAAKVETGGVEKPVKLEKEENKKEEKAEKPAPEEKIEDKNIETGQTAEPGKEILESLPQEDSAKEQKEETSNQ